MATVIKGRNNEQQFLNNSNKFQKLDHFDAYKQSLNPTVDYTENPAEVKKVKDTFARKKNEDEYVIIEYEGSNLISEVETAIMGIKL
jgi:hypothetical protein